MFFAASSSSSSSKVPTWIMIAIGILLPIVAAYSVVSTTTTTTLQFQPPNWQFLRIADLLLRPFDDKRRQQSDDDQHNANPKAQNEIFVLSAGLPRSGTDSLREALEYLGYHTYHAKQLQIEKHLEWMDLFQATYVNQIEESQYDTIINVLLQSGYNATTDFPTCLIFDKIIQRFPNAKLIVSVRDSPEVWAKSFQSTVGTVHGLLRQPPFNYYIPQKTGHFIEFFDEKLWNIIEYNDDPDGGDHYLPTIESLSRAYIQWIDHVRQTANQLNTTLLEYNVKQGWEPLCGYLGLDDDSSSTVKCPPIDTPFPHVNDSKEWVLILGIVRFVSNYWIQLLIAMFTICVTVLFKIVSWIITRSLFSTKKDKIKKEE